MPISFSRNRPFGFAAPGPWREYLAAAVLYSALAVWLHALHRPVFFWLCVVFALGSVAAVGYLWRSSRQIHGF